MNAVKIDVVKNAAAGAVVGGSLLFTAGLVVAHAQPEEESPVTSDGVVSVLVDGATAQDSVPLEEAAAAVTEVCGGDPASIAGVAQQVDTDGASVEVCPDVLIIQNSDVPVQSTPTESTVESEAPAVPGAEEEAAEEEAAEGE